MTPSRPYMVRAIYEWINDNNMTPHVLLDATRSGAVLPQAHVKDGRIVLNIAPGAVRDLFIRNEGISFSARFGGVPMQVTAPMQAVLAIYARENGQGMFFDEDEEFPDTETPDDEPPTPEPPAGKRPALRVVK
ncbi:MAG: ClpXP protease specificity-enhancing factor [Pedobacter sp.]|nr:ClpXP protease specificity-enhancing factor [Pedobacter sp.]